MKMNKKGSAYVWVMITFLVFAIGIVYMIMTKPVIIIQNLTWQYVANDGTYAQTYNNVVMVWKYWPIVALIGLIIAGILLSLKQEPYSGNLYG